MKGLLVSIFAICIMIGCSGRSVKIPADVPDNPIGFCYNYDEETIQCYMPKKVCYIYVDGEGSHVICSKR